VKTDTENLDPRKTKEILDEFIQAGKGFFMRSSAGEKSKSKKQFRSLWIALGRL
jgi:hypothetical protein